MLVAVPALLGLALSAVPHLDDGLKALDALDYDTATAELEQAKHQPGLSRTDLLRLLEGEGRLQATLGHHEAAVAAFEELLNLNPTFAANSTWAPKIRTPFFEAKSWQADHPALTLTATAPTAESAGKLGLNLVSDPLSLAKTARVHVAGVATPIDTATAGPGTLSVTLPADATGFWVELLDGNGSSLANLGDADHLQPCVHPAAQSPAAGVSASTDDGSPAVRYAGLAVGIGGAIGLGVGVVMGLQEKSAQDQFNSATRNSQGQITSLTRAAAISLDNQARTDGLVADVLFAAGGVAMATGVGLWIAGTFVSASPEPKGAAVALSGTWP